MWQADGSNGGGWVTMQRETSAGGCSVDVADRLIALARDLALELHPRRRRVLHVSIDSQIERDLGFDSLARVEFLLRIERALRVHLPEDILAEVETLRDLLTAIAGATGTPGPVGPDRSSPLTVGPVEAAPPTLETLTGVLDWYAERQPERPHVVIVRGRGEGQTITYRALHDDARAVARGMRALGLAPGERVAIMLPTGADYFSAFFGALYAGAIPVPIYPPMRLAQIERHLLTQAAILRNAGTTLLVTAPRFRAVATLLRTNVPALRQVESTESLRAAGSSALELPAPTERTALLQYTSGSTSEPKGVVLTHANILANIRAMAQAIEASPRDVFVSWLPLYHDMGLIGAWLGGLTCAMPVVMMSPLAFLMQPANWLWAIHKYRGTLSLAPNFAFELCVRKIEDRDIEGVDLSSLRLVMNGAEPVVPSTVRRFSERFRAFGFRPEAMAPVYGLAECTVGLAFPPLRRQPVIDRIQRQPFAMRGLALPAAAEDADALEFAACGWPLPGHQFRIVDATGHEAPERHEGRLQFRGPSATSGYFGDPQKTRELLHGAWYETGDRAYIAQGDVFPTGRIKDIIVRSGRNIHPQELEDAVGDIPGIRKGSVAVFGGADPQAGTERVILIAETRESEDDALAALRAKIHDVTSTRLGGAFDDIMFVHPHTVLKTSSGKIRRAASRKLYESGRLDAPPRPLWWQFASVAWTGVRAQARRALQAAVEFIYAGYWWTVVGLVGGVGWLAVAALPDLRSRWVVARAGARLLLAIAGMRPKVEGMEHLPRRGGVVVVNHTSYLDGLILCAVLPGRPLFVALAKVGRRIVPGVFLRRLGTLFLDPATPEGGLDATRVALGLARAGRRLVYFPEGRLGREPGLMNFHLGAFVVAATADVPVVPVAILGARSVLRPRQWFPRRGALRVVIAPPIMPEGHDWAVAIRLRDLAREEILDRCEEPDLAGDETAP